MGSLTTLGNKAKTTIFQSESHKLSLEFVANATLYKGQPVKLVAATGRVVPWTKDDGIHLKIGHVIDPNGPAAAGDNVTVMVSGYMVIMAISGGALSAGLVSYQSYDTTTDISGTKGWSVYSTPDVGGEAAEGDGWALEAAAGANELIRVLVRQS